MVHDKIKHSKKIPNEARELCFHLCDEPRSHLLWLAELLQDHVEQKSTLLMNPFQVVVVWVPQPSGLEDVDFFLRVSDLI